MAKEEKIHSCPVCSGKFTAKQQRRNDKKCPHCGVGVTGKRGKRDNKFYYEFIVTDPDSPEAQKAHAAQNVPEPEIVEPNPYGEVIYQEGNETIYCSDPGEAVEGDPHLRKNAVYHIVFINEVYTGWVRCPNCQNPLFQNRVIGGDVHQSHKCRNSKCKATVSFICEIKTPTGFGATAF